MARIKPQALLVQSKKKKAPSRISLTTIIAFNLIIFLVVFSLYATYKYWYRRLAFSQIWSKNLFLLLSIILSATLVLVATVHHLSMISKYGGLLLSKNKIQLLFRSSNQPDLHLNTLEHSEVFEEPKKFDLPSYAILNTAKGSITVELYKDASPEVVDKFLDLCQKGHFKGMPFHRVIKHYVIQGGDLQDLGAAEDWTLKGKAHSKLAMSPKHEAFMLGTSKAKSESKGFELFITTAPIPDLNDKLVVFGRVIKGEDVVQEIEEVDTDEHYRPKSPIGIIDITLKQEP